MPPIALEALTTRVLSTALDAASLRQQLIATNIANVNTPGYVTQRVSFEALFEAGLSATESKVAQPVLYPQIQAFRDAAGATQGVALDMEMASLAQNTLHQQVLLRGLQRHLGMLSSAVSEGKR